MRDFEGRCAYSLQHVNRVGVRLIEVDHFNPKLRGLERNNYSNLFPSTRHCNASKRDTWPEPHFARLGARFLNPTKEQDYGVHIFEDRTSARLVGITPAGKYHIRCCDLNAPHLILERAERARLRRLLNDYPVTAKLALQIVNEGEMLDASALLRRVLETMIPEIPGPPLPGSTG
ncbi:MAG: HNH endonuclease [Verrucomicrobia bacterium]|nr:HNH endonuclease [Verrucomicrobiota bacterium]